MIHERAGEDADASRPRSRRVVVPRASAPAAAIPLDNEPPRGARVPRGSSRFASHLHESMARTGYTPDDDFQVALTADLIAPHIDAIADAVHEMLMRDAGTASYFSAARDDGTAHGSAHRDLVRDWLRCLIDDPLDADAATAIARIAHEHIRPRDDDARPVPARYMAAVLARIADDITGILVRSDGTDGSDGIGDLAAAASAWSKRCALQLDLMLAVYSSTQGSAHWY